MPGSLESRLIEKSGAMTLFIRLFSGRFALLVIQTARIPAFWAPRISAVSVSPTIIDSLGLAFIFLNAISKIFGCGFRIFSSAEMMI